ncbi:hypothetical protein J6590_062073 [Homalodisca vitripennis]|nr:hypothetical protein J6590_062073 [Homalodisca vitripennis]
MAYGRNSLLVERKMVQLGHAAPVALGYQGDEDLSEIHERHKEREGDHHQEQELLVESELSYVGKNVIKVHLTLVSSDVRLVGRGRRGVMVYGHSVVTRGAVSRELQLTDAAVVIVLHSLHTIPPSTTVLTLPWSGVSIGSEPFFSFVLTLIFVIRT